MEKERLLVFLSSLNEAYQSFKFAELESQNKFNDFINILEDKFISKGGVFYNIISQEEEILLRNYKYVYNGKFSKQNLYQKYFENFDIFFNLNPVLSDQLKNKILEIKEYSQNYSGEVNNIELLQDICSSLNKIVFKFKLPSKNSNFINLLDETFSFIYKSEDTQNVDFLKKVILNLKSLKFLINIELEILLNEKHFLTNNIPENIKSAYNFSNKILYEVLINDNFENVLLKNFINIYKEFIPQERLEYLKLNSKSPIIEPLNSEVKEYSREEQAKFVKNRIIDFCFGVRMIYLKDYIFNTDKNSLENYYILIISSFNRLKQVLIDNNRL